MKKCDRCDGSGIEPNSFDEHVFNYYNGQIFNFHAACSKCDGTGNDREDFRELNLWIFHALHAFNLARKQFWHGYENYLHLFYP